MNSFDRLERMARRSIDRVNSTRFILHPMAEQPANPNARARKDTSRPVKRGRGVFDNLPSEAGIQLGVRKTYRESNDFRSLRVGSEPTLSIDRDTNFPDGVLPRQGDLIVLPDLPDESIYEVTSAQPDGHSTIMLKLVRSGKPIPQ